MTVIEDPGRQLSNLQQCLSSDKKPLALFLGAGCPMAIQQGPGLEPLIPGVAGITHAVRAQLKANADDDHVLSTVEQHFQPDKQTGATVEDMLTHIRALRAVAGRDGVLGLSAESLDRLDRTICQCIHGLVDKRLPDTKKTPYHDVAFWVDAMQRSNPIEIFTTNYDLLMEQAFEEARVPYFDGFVGSTQPLFDLRAMEEDTLPPRWARLWKLHGSINWCYSADTGVSRGAAVHGDQSNGVIYPSHLKYQESRRMPYLAMIDRLRAFLKQPTATLVTCGYSFRDEHVNEVIVQGLRYSQSVVTFALLFNQLKDHPEATALAQMRSNLTVLARDGGVIGRQNVAWCEKEVKERSLDDNDWLTWQPADDSGNASKLSANLMLGNFQTFGKLLRELAGTTPTTLASPDAP